MIRDAVASSSRAVLVAGAAAALTAATPAIAAAPATGGATPPQAAVTAAAGTSPAAPAQTPTATPATPVDEARERAATPARRTKVRPRIRITSARSAGLVGNRAVYAGRVVGAERGDRVRLDVRSGSKWRPVATVRVKEQGRFRIGKQIAAVGDQQARVRVLASDSVHPTHRRVKRVHGFRRSFASYFGPGLYGSALACGGRLSPSTRGVAHKTLPCGTKVTLRVGSRQVTTRVVDRGPYIAGREWDLTAATRNALGFGDIGPVWVDR